MYQVAVLGIMVGYLANFLPNTWSVLTYLQKLLFSLGKHISTNLLLVCLNTQLFVYCVHFMHKYEDLKFNVDFEWQIWGNGLEGSKLAY